MTKGTAETRGGSEPRTPLAQRQYDWGVTPPVEGIIGTVTAATGRPSETLSPLETVVDTDAISVLLAESGGDGPTGGVHLTFEYEGLVVSVNSAGRVELYDT